MAVGSPVRGGHCLCRCRDRASGAGYIVTPFPLSEANPVEHRADLPARADVVVIGGGVIGVTTALFLARAGVSVVLVEKGRIAAEQSSRNWGWIRVQGRDPAEIPIAQEAQRLWPALAREVDADIHLRQAGVLYLARDEAEMARYAAWLDLARPYGVTTRLLDRAALLRHLPGAQGSWPGAMWTPSDMRAEPFVSVPALARLAVAAGARIREGCAARALDIEAGKVAGVVTEAGRLRAPAVVLAGGAWSSLFLRRHGVRLPQLSVRATAMRTGPLPEVFAGGAVDHRLAFRRRADGGYTLAPEGHHDFYIGPDAFRALRAYIPQLRSDPWGTQFRLAAPRGFPDSWTVARRWSPDSASPFEAMRVLSPAPNMGMVAQTRAAFAETFPQIGPVQIESAWAGMIDTLPDQVPVVAHVAALPGLTLATGMSGHGFGIGPAFGRILADLVQGNAPGHDLARFRFARFSDGSRIEI
ncbi:MAG TPA: FAD-binding oxidoreductase, partial [Rhodobacterales bacterium]|nr:FAD-binding oxidoreductase [Rhodobacterales bacterium]